MLSVRLISTLRKKCRKTTYRRSFFCVGYVYYLSDMTNNVQQRRPYLRLVTNERVIREEASAPELAQISTAENPPTKAKVSTPRRRKVSHAAERGSEFKEVDGAASAKTELVGVAAATAPSTAQKDAARKLILDYMIRAPRSEHERSVRDWLNAANRVLETGEGGLESPVDLYFNAWWALDGMGIMLSGGGKSLGLELAAFATVIEPKKLLRHLPQLKGAAPDLYGLPLY